MTLATPATLRAGSRSRSGNGSSLPNRYLVVRITNNSPSSSRTMPSEASKNPRSKPSCTSIKSTANPMPATERASLRLFDTRLRQASGTERVAGRRAIAAASVIRVAAPSEDLGRVGAPQPEQRQHRRDRRHEDADHENPAQLHRAHRHRQQGLGADHRI